MYKIYLFENQRGYYMQRIPDLETLHYYFRGMMSMDTKGARFDPMSLTMTYPDNSFYIAVRA